MQRATTNRLTSEFELTTKFKALNWISQRENLIGANHKCRSIAFHQCRCFFLLLANRIESLLQFSGTETIPITDSKEKKHILNRANENTWQDIYEWYQWITRIKWRNRKNYSDFGIFHFKFRFRVYFHLSFGCRKPQLAASIMDEQKILCSFPSVVSLLK